MTSICTPDGTDWSCAYTPEELAVMRADPIIAAVMARSESLAWMTLAALTADQVGTCPITVRPCKAGCRNSDTYLTAPVGLSGHYAGVYAGRATFAPYINGQGVWVNSCGCGSANDCSCAALCEAILPGPVGDITEVLLDGAVLDPTAYRVDNGNRLVRIDGDCWPACQDMAAAPTEADTFAVTYYRGAAPDDVLLWVAGLLAVEWYKACNNDKTCRLPRGARNISRQGIQYEIERNLFSEGTTGIPEVDAVVARYNPYGLKMAPVISTPQTIRRPRQTTWSR
jgi:hypothetical protein